MKFTLLSPEDAAALGSDRELVTAIIDAHFGGEFPSGTQPDLRLLQRILDSGPHTEDAGGETVALGTIVGDLLSRALGMPWVHFHDEHGDDLGLRYGATSIVVFPRGMIIKRVEEGEHLDLQHLYDGVISEIHEIVASGQFR